MPRKKSRAVSIEWLEQHILPKLGDTLRQDLKATLDALKQLPTSLPASSLELNDPINIFGLRYNPLFDAWALADNDLYEIPALLVAIKNEYAFVTEGSFANGALVRSQIIDILMICISEEKRLALRECYQFNATPSTQLNPAPLLLQLEAKLSRLVTYRKEKRVLQGTADYSLWYNKDEPMGTNLILIEAKEGMLSMVDGQLVAYMGIVNRTRESQGKQNNYTHGISTDGNEFQFWRLYKSGELTHSRKLDWKGGDGSRIVSYLRLVIRSTILASQGRDVTLNMFRDPEKTKSFDHGNKRFDLPKLGDDVDDDDDYDDDEDDDDDMDIVDPSSLNGGLHR